MWRLSWVLRPTYKVRTNINCTTKVKNPKSFRDLSYSKGIKNDVKMLCLEVHIKTYLKKNIFFSVKESKGKKFLWAGRAHEN